MDRNFGTHVSAIPSQTEGMQVMNRPGITYVDSGLSSESFNIIHIHNGGLVREEDVNDIIHHYQLKNLAYCIWVHKQNYTRSLQQIFSNLSISLLNTEPGMFLDLSGCKPTLVSGNENIIHATNESQIIDFAKILAASQAPPDENVLSFYRRTSKLLLNSGIKLFLYYGQGQAVSVVECVPSDQKSIGVYNLYTLPRFRGKGFANTLLIHALRDAREQGFSYAMLQASEAGKRIYDKLGFEKITEYFEFH